MLPDYILRKVEMMRAALLVLGVNIEKVRISDLERCYRAGTLDMQNLVYVEMMKRGEQQLVSRWMVSCPANI